MRWLLFVLVSAVLLAACAGPQYSDVCRTVPGGGSVAVECVDFGFTEDRRGVRVLVAQEVAVASFLTDEDSGRCSVSDRQGGSLIVCDVFGEPQHQRVFLTIEGGLSGVDDVEDFAIEVQVS